MSISGTFSTMALDDLLQWIERGRKSGTLVVQGERYAKRILTSDGRVIASSSDDPNDHIGHYLLREGLITENVLRRAIETQKQTRAMLGRILVSVEALTEAELQRALHRKAEETIFSLFLWRDARFEFQPGALPATIAVPLDLQIGEVLKKGRSWAGELDRIRRVLASSRAVLERTNRPLRRETREAGSLDARILALVDGRRSIADICLAVHASEFVVSRALNGLLEAGLVSVIRKRAESPPPPRNTFTGLLDEARSLLRAGEAEASLKVLEEARPLCPHDASLGSLTAEAQEAFIRQVHRDGLAPTLVPVLARPAESLTEASLTPEQMFILSRVDGTWDLQSIISVCPFPETEALIQLKRLKDQGVLELRTPVA